MSVVSPGPQAFAVMTAWESLPKLYPPEEWSGPVPPGFVGAMGMRLHQVEAWRPVSVSLGWNFVSVDFGILIAYLKECPIYVL